LLFALTFLFALNHLTKLKYSGTMICGSLSPNHQIRKI